MGGSTNPMQRRGEGGELVAPEATGARRTGRGDGERRHGALQRRYPSHPRRPPLPLPAPNRRVKPRRITPFLEVPPDRIMRSSIFPCSWVALYMGLDTQTRQAFVNTHLGLSHADGPWAARLLPRALSRPAPQARIAEPREAS
jgi:hypothetical protein